MDNTEQKESFSFEDAYQKLEEILEELSSNETPLEKSLTLYEMADKLIRACSHKLNAAESRIQMLIKDRNGSLDTSSGAPQAKPLESSSNAMIDRNI